MSEDGRAPDDNLLESVVIVASNKTTLREDEATYNHRARRSCLLAFELMG